MQRKLHLANVVRANGQASSLCDRAGKRGVVDSNFWTVVINQVTCGHCKRIIRERKTLAVGVITL